MNEWFLAAACSLGVKRGVNCKVQDKDAGYAFDLTPLAEHKWGKNDSYLLQVDKSVYSYQLKVRLSLCHFLNSPFSIVYKNTGAFCATDVWTSLFCPAVL